MAKILVTGGAGFIGSHLVDGLIEKGNEVVAVDNLSTGKKENVNPRAVFYNKDICDAAIAEIFSKEKPEIVFHLAAQINVRKSVKDPAEDARTNIIGSINVIECFKRCGARKFIFTSTGGAIYGEADIIPTPETYREFPLSPYGIAKLAVEKYLYYYHKVFGLEYSVLRLANVYGPRQNSEGEAGVVAIFCQKMLAGIQPEIYGSGNQMRDFVYVKDVVGAHMAAMVGGGGIYNVGTEKETSINEIFDRLKVLTGASCLKKRIQAKIGEQQRSCLDCSKIKNELHWQPEYDLNKGLGETSGWFMDGNSKPNQ